MRMKRVLSLILAVILCVGMIPAMASAATYGDLTYTVSDGEVTITGCDLSATSVTIPETINGYPVTAIGGSAFSYCEKLTSITIPGSITSIGNRAFSYCYKLASVTIPTSVASLGTDAFVRCDSLQKIAVDKGNENYSSDSYGVLFNKDKTELIKAPGVIVNYTIPDNVTTIGSHAFSYSSVLTSVSIPAGVTSIRDYAFSNCSSLTSVTIPDGVTSIGDWAFSGCSSLTSVTIPDSVTSIGKVAFYDCSSLTSVTIPDSVTSIRDSAFRGCSSLTSVTIPNGVTSIGDFAFYGCSSLASVTIPGSVTSIGWYAFGGCSGLQSINVYTGNWTYQSIDGVLFSKDGKTLVAVPGGKTGAYTIPDSVTSIGSDAFSHCNSLTSVTIPDSVTRIGDYAFSGCSSLQSIKVDTKNTKYQSIDGVLFSKDGKTLVAVPGGKTGAYTIPEGVTSIRDSAFRGCSNLTSVTIPDSVTRIGDYAFSGCSSLTSVTIPNSVTSIGDWAFYNCRSLASVTIPASVTSIGKSVFCGCSSLTSVTIPASVTSIGSDAFYYCSGLTSIYFTGNAPTFGSYVFYKVTATAYYPGGDATWTEEVRQSYGGTITWVAYGENEKPWETPAEHTHSFTKYVSNNDATCTADGTKTAKCDHCDATNTITDTGSAKGHSFTKYISNGNATCTADGTKTAKCDNCDETDTAVDVGSATGHSATHHAKVDSTYDEGGSVEYWSCSLCKKNFSDEACTKELTDVTLPPLDPKVDASLTEDGTLKITGVLSQTATTTNTVLLAVYRANGQLLCIRDISALPQDCVQLECANIQGAATVKIFRLDRETLAPKFAAYTLRLS